MGQAAGGQPVSVPSAPHRTESYGPDPSQLYDVWLPPGDGARQGRPPFGVTVVVVHGGFWRAAYDRAHATSQAQALADAGFHVAVPEYRRTGMAGGGWPGTFTDVRAGLAAIRRDPGLPEPTLLVGHSAGGHLAVWLLHQPEAGGVLGALSLAGCVDLTRTAELGLGAGAATALMGGPPPNRLPGDLAGAMDERYALADPARLAPAPAPVRLLHGADDDVVPPAVSASYRRVCERRGTSVPLAVIPGCEHYGLIDPAHPAFGQVVATLRAMADIDGTR